MPDSAPWFASLWMFFTLGGVAVFALLVLAIRVLRGFKRTEHPRCRTCDYTLVNTTSNVADANTAEPQSADTHRPAGAQIANACPECGCKKRPITHRLSGKQQRRRMAAIALLLALFIHCFGSQVVWYRMMHESVGARQPWYQAIVPTSVLIVMMPWSDDDHADLVAGRLYGYDAPINSKWQRLDYLPRWRALLLEWACEQTIDRMIDDPAQSFTVEMAVQWQIELSLREDNDAGAVVAMLESGDQKRIELFISCFSPFTYFDENDPWDPALIRAMIRRMNDPSGFLREEFAEILFNHLPRHRILEFGVLPDLLEAFIPDTRDYAHDLTGDMITSIGYTASEDEKQQVVSILTKALDHPEVNVRTASLDLLWHYTDDHERHDGNVVEQKTWRQAAIDAIWIATTSEAPKVRLSAWSNLVNLLGDEHDPIKLAHPSRDGTYEKERLQAMIAMAQAERVPTAALAELLDSLGHDDRDIRSECFHVLHRMRLADAALIEKLRTLADDERVGVADDAKDFLHTLKTEFPQLLP